MSKKRLDVLLHERGLSESRQRAQADIMGGWVYVDGQQVLKAGTAVAEEAVIEVRGQAIPYVSRGGLKLAKAMDVFGLDLYQAGLGEKIEGMAAELYAGPGAVRRTLHKYVSAR